MTSGPLVPAWVACSVGGLFLVVLALHLMSLRASPLETRRKRIRTVTTVVMMLVTPLAAYAFGVAEPARARAYVLVWLVVTGAMGLVLVLALLDMGQSVREHRRHLRRLRSALAAEVAADRARTLDGPGGAE
ncbi:MAG: hypothetical protein JNM80_01985 [Phycisphaerae bacterium]|nr:hypothetical protein [Phycisphaerae bacterium]